MYIVMSREKKILIKNYAEFCNILKVEDNLLPHLVGKEIISIENEHEIRSKPCNEKASSLLKHITTPLGIGYSQGFYDLLDIMINYGKPHTEVFARKISQELSNHTYGKFLS